jgi:uncharacterized protein
MHFDELVERIERHRGELTSLHVRTLSVFGSVARGEAAASSDVDLLVEFDRPVGLFHFVTVKDRLEALLGLPVDLVTPRGLKAPLRERILAEARRVA